MEHIKKISVEIMGEEYVLKSDEDVQYVKRLAATIHQRMGQIAAANPNLQRNKIAVLAALYYADELHKLKQEHQQLMQCFE